MTDETSRLHEKDEPRIRSGVLYSLLDIMGATAICDFCGRWQRIKALTVQQMGEAAEKLGWIERDGKDVCPICARAALGDKP